MVSVVLTNQWAYVTDYNDTEFKKLDSFWSYVHPKAYFMPKVKAGVWDGRIKFISKGRIPAGIFRASWQECQNKTGVNFTAQTDYPTIPFILPGREVQKGKYDYQGHCVEKMARAVHRGGGMVIAGTGVGKTAIAGQFFSRLTCPCLFVVDQISLLYQSQAELAKWAGEPVGVVGDSRYELERITAATVQTLDGHLSDPKFLHWFRHVKVVVVDELHEQLSRRGFDVLNTIKPVARYGLTATLQTGKKDVRLRAWAFAGPVIFKFPYLAGVRKGVLTDGKAVQLLFPGDTERMDYQEEYQEEILENTLKLRSVVAVTEWMIAQGRSVMVLAERIAHVKALRRALFHIPHGVVRGGVTDERRQETISRFEAGEIHLIIASRVFKKGVNIKRVSGMVDVAEMYSKNDAQQKFGRGVRLFEGKTGLWYVDVGTDKGRFGRNARSRAKALKSQGVPLTRIAVNTVREAVQAVQGVFGAGVGAGNAA